jgi:excisionase family DNA binding protein
MINAEIRIIVDGHEVSPDAFAQCVVREVRTAVREEIRQNLGNDQNRSDHSNQAANRETPRQAVSIREAARLLSISPRTVDKYVALKVIRTFRIGRRVLIPMNTVGEIVSKGIPLRR